MLYVRRCLRAEGPIRELAKATAIILTVMITYIHIHLLPTNGG